MPESERHSVERTFRAADARNLERMSTPDLEKLYALAKKQFRKESDSVLLDLKDRVTPKVLQMFSPVFEGVSGVSLHENGFYDLSRMTPDEAALVAVRIRKMNPSDFSPEVLCPEVLADMDAVSDIHARIVGINGILLERFSLHPEKSVVYSDQVLHNRVFRELFFLRCSNMLNRGMDMYRILAADESVYRARMDAVDQARSPESLKIALDNLTATFRDPEGIRFTRQRYAEFLAGEMNRNRQMLPKEMVDPPRGVGLMYLEKERGLDRACAWLGIGFLTAPEQQLIEENLVRESVEKTREEGAVCIVVGACFGNPVCGRYRDRMSAGDYDSGFSPQFRAALKRAEYFSAARLDAVYYSFLPNSERVSLLDSGL